jgi:hypothetical protein
MKTPDPTLATLDELIERLQLSLKIIRESPAAFGGLEGTVIAAIHEAELWRSALTGTTLAGRGRLDSKAGRPDRS